MEKLPQALPTLGPIVVDGRSQSTGPSVREPDEYHLDQLVADGLSTANKELPGPLSAEEQKALESNGKWEPSVLRPRHREILRRILEGATYVEIAEAMGIHKQTVMLVATSPLFRAELTKLESEADFNIVQRAESMSNEALDKLKTLMRSARSEFLQKAAAERILDTAGYSKIERRIVGVVSGEDVIRELNKRRREAAEGSNGSHQPARPPEPPPSDTDQPQELEWVKDPRQMPGDWGRE
jgi:hypothetical protein